jgi:TetR/AcrR family transcriptional regulator
MPQAKRAADRKTRIQAQNEGLILDAALDVFSVYGYRGSTVDQIAAKCGLSKPNLLYYFRRKEDIYRAVLERTLADWLAPLRALDAAGDPADELTRYISAKMRLSRERPEASRLFANEILHGAPVIGAFLRGPLRELVDAEAAVIRAWIAIISSSRSGRRPSTMPTSTSRCAPSWAAAGNTWRLPSVRCWHFS